MKLQISPYTQDRMDMTIDFRVSKGKEKNKKKKLRYLMHIVWNQIDAECRASELYSLFKDNHLHIHVIRAALCL
jgi:hypothetical protein